MDKENFNLKPILDPLTNVSVNDFIRNHYETLAKEQQLAKDREKMIEQFRKYKERIKAE